MASFCVRVVAGFSTEMKDSIGIYRMAFTAIDHVTYRAINIWFKWSDTKLVLTQAGLDGDLLAFEGLLRWQAQLCD